MLRTRVCPLVSLSLFALLAAPAFTAAQAPRAPAVDALGDPLPAGAVARLGTTRLRQGDPVRFIAYPVSGQLLTIGDTAGYVWDAATGKELRRIAVPRPATARFPFTSGPAPLLSGDGKTLLLGLEAGDCVVVDVASGKQLREFKVDAGAAGMAMFRGFPGGGAAQNSLSHDGRLLLTHDGSNPFGGVGNGTVSKIKLWDTVAGKLLRELDAKEKGAVFTAAVLTRDGKALLAVEGPGPIRKGGADPMTTRLRLLDTATGNELRSVPLPAGSMNQLQLSPDGKVVAAGSQGQAVRLLDAATGKELRQFPNKQQGNPSTTFFAHDGKTLFVVGATEATQYEVETGKELRQFPMARRKDDVFGMAFGRMAAPAAALSPDGRTLALPAGTTVTRWDVQTGKEIAGLPAHRDRIDSVAFGPRGQQILTGSSDGTLYLWDAAGKRLREFARDPEEKQAPQLRGGQIMNLFQVRGGFSPDGKNVVGLWYGGKLHIWDGVTGKLLRRVGDVKGHTAFAYSPDGRFLAANGSGGMVRLWEPTTGKEVRQFVWAAKAGQDMGMLGGGLEQGMYSTAFSADGRVLYSGALLIEPGGLKAVLQGWEIATGGERVRFDTGTNAFGSMAFDAIGQALDSVIVSFAFAPDGRYLAEAGLSSVKLRDLQSGDEVRVFGGRQIAAATAAFSPDGKFLVAGKQDGAIRLWDVATGTVLLDYPAHRSAVTALAFSADGKLLASGAADTTVVVWDWDHLRRSALAPKSVPPGAGHEAAWAELAKEDAPRAYAAIKSLAAGSAETVAFLKARLRPVPPVDAAQLERLLTDLDARQFPARQKAEQALAKLGDLAAKAIRDKLASAPSLEVTRRLEALLGKLEGATVSPEVRQTLRAVEVLERIGTPEARSVLEALAAGAPGHRITEDARRTVQRLSKQAALSP